MRETAFLRLPDGDPQNEVVCRLAAEHTVASSPRRVRLSELAALASGRRIVVFVPTADVRLARVNLPVRQHAKALQAVPYLLEEAFAEDVEQLHFALGARQADGSFPVAALSRERFEGWLAQLSAAGIDAHALVPEVLALPLATEGWTALADGDEVLVRTGEYSGFAAAQQDLPTLLQLAAGEAQPPRLRVLVPQTSAADFSRLQSGVELSPGYADTLDALARHYRPEHSINLLQGPYQRQTSWQQYFDPWKTVGWLTAATFAAGAAVNGGIAWRDNRSAAAQEAANEERFTQLFPNERATAYLSAQVEALARRSQGGDAGVLFLLQRFAAAQADTPGLNLQSFQFRDRALFLDMTASNVEALEQLRAWFSANPGAKLEVQTADAGSTGVKIRAKISAS